MLNLSEKLRIDWPEAAAGVLVVRNVTNPQNHPALEQAKSALEARLREQFGALDRAAIKALPHIQAYNNYYKAFDKTYHVQLQLESVVFKGKSIPRVAALVEAMFMAELGDQLLTAGHDLDKVDLPLGIESAGGGETFTTMSGQEQALKPKDMFIHDQSGILSSILYGPDRRTAIAPETTSALYTVYGVPGIGRDDLLAHLHQIEATIRLFAPTARTETLEIFPVK
jgi:DNA/RNA-binding domain of Phe-tRNA-synthetase-like protein